MSDGKVGIFSQHYIMPIPVILIIDDHPVVADSVAAIVASLNSSLKTEVAHSMRNALSVIAKELNLFAIVTDLSLPDSKGIGTVEKIVAATFGRSQKINVVVFSGVEHALLRQHCLAIGAHSFITKNENVQALRSTLEIIFRPLTVTPNIGVASERVANTAKAPDLSQLLTKKQTAILQDLAAGYSNAEIATRHNVGINTIKTHVKDIFERIGVRNRTEAAKLYFAQTQAGSG